MNKLNIKKVTELKSDESKSSLFYRVEVEGKVQSALAVNPNHSYWYQLQKPEGNTVESMYFASVPKDPWEIYGSDHNSGLSLYADTQEIDKISSQVMNILENGLKKHAGGLAECFIGFNRWDFEDNTSLILIEIDFDYYQIEMKDLQFKNILNVHYGAMTDDIMLQEILLEKVSPYLKKIKMGENSDEEDNENGYGECVQMSDKQLTKKDSLILINMCYHIFCTLMQWQTEDIANKPEDDCTCEIEDRNIILAKKLEKYKTIKNIKAPTDNEKIELFMQEGGSNKYYNVIFSQNDKYKVSVAYGRVGSKENISTLVETDNLEIAQKEYLKIVEDKLAKGYNLKPISVKLKP